MAKTTVTQAIAIRDVIRYLAGLAAPEPSDVYTADKAADALVLLANDAFARMMAGPGEAEARAAIEAVEWARRGASHA